MPQTLNWYTYFYHMKSNLCIYVFYHTELNVLFWLLSHPPFLCNRIFLKCNISDFFSRCHDVLDMAEHFIIFCTQCGQ